MQIAVDLIYVGFTVLVRNESFLLLYFLSLSSVATSCRFKQPSHTMTALAEWSLSDEQRQDTVGRIMASISTMSFFRNTPMPDEVVSVTAAGIEKKAYTVARVEARTTTGMRPHTETLRAYIRKLAALVLEAVQNGVAPEHALAATALDSNTIDLTGAREFLTKETAEELLGPMLKEGATIKKIKFSTKSFGVDAAEVAAKAIRNVKSTLEEADISDIMAGRPEDEALAALRILASALGDVRNLKVLDLSDNALGEKGIRAAAAAFANQTSLESIAFRNVGCSVHGCAAVAELITNTQSLKSISLYNNMSGDEGAASIASLIARCTSLEEFSMVSSRVGPEGGAALGQALATGPKQLRTLNIHDNPMTEEAAEALAIAITSQPGLRILNLNDTCLTNDGVIRIASALIDNNEQLEELELSLNEVNPQGAEAIAAAVASKPSLSKLNLRENELEDDGALIIAKALVGVPGLKTLDLSGNQLHRAGACTVAKVVAAAAKNIEMVLLDENEISDGGVAELQELLGDALGPLDDNMGDDDDDEEIVEDLAEDLLKGLKL